MTKPKGVLPPAEENKPKKRRLKKNEGSNAAESDKAFVGQEVHGIVDGSFDAGYLLTVKVGDSPLVLRGLVFTPGLSVPLSKINDVAPTIKATARDQQIVVPMSVQLSGESSPAARASTGTSFITTEAPADMKQEQVNEEHAASIRIPPVEQGRMERDHSSVGADPLTSENEITAHEAFVANEVEQVHLGQANLNDIATEEGNVQQFGFTAGTDGLHTSLNPAIEAAEAGLQRPLSDAYAQDDPPKPSLACTDGSNERGHESGLQA